MSKNEILFNDPKNGPFIQRVSLPTLEGVLDPGMDDIPGVTPDMTFDPNTDSITVDVSIDDSTLNTGDPKERYIWQRTFTFNAPGVQEP